MSKKLSPEIDALVEGPRGPDHLTDAERRLLAAIRAEGLELVAGMVQGPFGYYPHGRVIRRKVA